MAGTMGCHPARGSESRKAGPSSDRRLQPACAKPELLVIADQHAAVNAFPGLVHTARHTTELLVIADQHAAVNAFPGLVHTARHTTRVVCTRSRRPNPQGAEASKVWRVRGVKS